MSFLSKIFTSSDTKSDSANSNAKSNSPGGPGTGSRPSAFKDAFKEVASSVDQYGDGWQPVKMVGGNVRFARTRPMEEHSGYRSPQIRGSEIVAKPEIQAPDGNYYYADSLVLDEDGNVVNGAFRW